MDFLRRLKWFGTYKPMKRYTNADFGDDDSINSVQLTEGISSSATHIRYHPGSKIWELRSNLEKVFLFLIGFFLMVIIVLSIIVNVVEDHLKVSLENEAKLRSDQPCLNKSCVQIASNILSSMDFSVDPCEDFYAYSCNAWVQANPNPEGKANWNNFKKLEQNNLLIIKRVIEKPISTFKSKAEIKAKMYYESCMDVNDTVEALGSKPLVDVINKLGGWNISGNFNVSSFSLQNTLQIVQNKYSIEALFSSIVGEDDKNSSRHILQLDQSGLGLPTRDNYLNKSAEHQKILDAYLEYMIKFGVLLGGEPNATRNQMKAVIEFETKLANITIPIEQRRDDESQYNLMTIEELHGLANFTDWRQLFENALKVVNKKVTSKEPIVVFVPTYIGNLSKIVNDYMKTTEGKIILNNYLVWHTAKSFTFYLSKPFRDSYRGFKVALVGSDGSEEPQWRYCLQETNTALGFPLGAMFIREVFHQESKQHAEIMINNVRNAFKENFKNLKWMDDDTRKLAIEKADAISDMIGYPEFIKDSHLDEKFENLSIRNNEYFANNVNLCAFNLRKNWEKINEPVNKTTWNMVPSDVNAYYTATKNQMVFPAGILQSPFYDPSYPPALNYGGMGVVMGHELTHGFDDQGRQYDKNGNLNHWWNNQTVSNFKKRTQCVVNQYGKYELNGKNVNGNITLGENIADNGGLKAGYHAYLKYMEDKPEPKQLPGLPLNHKQLFFVAFAQVWCQTMSKEVSNLELERDSHSPAPFRVRGALSNLKEFGEAFDCKPNSKMSPVNRCEVW